MRTILISKVTCFEKGGIWKIYDHLATMLFRILCSLSHFEKPPAAILVLIQNRKLSSFLSARQKLVEPKYPSDTKA